MNLTLDLVTPEYEIRRMYMEALAKKLGANFKVNSALLRDLIGIVIEEAIKNSPEYASLIDGILQANFGLINPTNNLDIIIGKIKESVVIETTPITYSAGGLKGGLAVKILPNQADYAILTDMEEAYYYSTSKKRGTSFKIEWLKWLLNSGDVVNNEYYIDLNDHPSSRSGKAIMVKGGKWVLLNHIPPEFAGFPGNNFITRALNDYSPAIEHAIGIALRG